ncbi:MAG: DMT family transporter [Tuberibacillus sp.]
MIIGLFFAITAGACISLQNIFNSKVSEKAGTLVTTTLVLGLGCLSSFIIGFIILGKDLFIWQNMKPWYGFCGLIGIGVVTCLVLGFKYLGPTYAISIVLTSQLLFGLFYDFMGWFGLEKVPFNFKQLIGVLVIIAGILVFKLGGVRGENSRTESPKEVKESIHNRGFIKR